MFGGLLVVSELALSVVLLIGAGLLIRSFARLQDVSPGFNPRGVLTFDLTMTGQKYNDKQTILNTYRQLWERLEHLPGAIAAGGVTSLPLSEPLRGRRSPSKGERRFPARNFLMRMNGSLAGTILKQWKFHCGVDDSSTSRTTRQRQLWSLLTSTWPRQLWPGQNPDRQAHSYCRTPVEGPVADGRWRGRTREARCSRL